MNILNCPDVLTVATAAQVLNVGRTTMYRLIQTGEIQHLKIGRKILIPRKFLQIFLETGVEKCYNKDTDGRNLPCCEKGETE